MSFELLMLLVAFAPFGLSYLCGWVGFAVAFMIWVRMANHVNRQGILKENPQHDRAFDLFVLVGILGGALGAWVHS